MIGVFVSEEPDISLLLSKSEIINVEIFGKGKIWEVKTEGKMLLLASTGYNKINIGIAAGYIIKKYNISLIIGLGNCGLLGDCDLGIGDIAIGDSALQYSVDSSALGYQDAVIPGVGLGQFDSVPKLVAIAKDACRELRYHFKAARIATSEKFVAANAENIRIATRFDCQFIDMECGCIGEIAYIFNIPVIYVKGISNYANEAADIDYEEYASHANFRSNEVFLAMLKDLNCDTDTCYDSPL